VRRYLDDARRPVERRMSELATLQWALAIAGAKRRYVRAVIHRREADATRRQLHSLVEHFNELRGAA